MKKLMLTLIVGIMLVSLVMAVNSTNVTNLSSRANSSNVANVSAANATLANATPSANVTLNITVNTTAVAAAVIPANVTEKIQPSDDEIVRTKMLEVRYAQAMYFTAIKEADMMAAINYIDSINGSSAKLALLFKDFKDKTAEILSSDSKEEINSQIEELKTVVDDFKTELRSVMDSSGGSMIDLVNEIQDAKLRNRWVIADLEKNYYDTRTNNTLMVFDMRVEKAQSLLNISGENGADIGESQLTLDEIILLRKQIVSALQQKNVSLMNNANAKLKILSESLADLTLNLKIEQSDKPKLKYWAELGARISDRTPAVILELKALNISTSDLKNASDILSASSKKALTALENNKIEDAKTSISNMQKGIDGIIAAYNAITADASLPKAMKDKIEAMNKAISKAADALKADLA